MEVQTNIFSQSGLILCTPIVRFQVNEECQSIGTCVKIWSCFTTGHVSWRSSENGSYFIQALFDILSEHGKTEDLLSMMTMVVHKVATSEPTHKTGTYVQTACIVTQLIRRVYFDPKN